MNTSIELTPQEILRRRLIAFLKGWIIGYAKSNGMKWSTKRSVVSNEFSQGMKLGEQCKFSGSKTATVMHIVYSRIRKAKPHLGTLEKDEETIQNYGSLGGMCFAHMTKLFGAEWREMLNG